MDRKANCKFIASGILSLVVASAGGVTALASAPAMDMHEMQSEIKHLQHAAHSPEQFFTLAGLYKQEQDDYVRKAAEEKQEWQRRSQFTGSIEEKYPRPVDEARNLYEYYTYKAKQAGELSAKYTQMAIPDAAAKP